MHHAFTILAAASLVLQPRAPPRPPTARLAASRLPRVCMMVGTGIEQSIGQLDSEAAYDSCAMPDGFDGYQLRERAAALRDIALSISVRRTCDEAELALRLADDYDSDPSLLADIDFASLARRLERDLKVSDGELRRAALLQKSEIDAIAARQRKALEGLRAIRDPEVLAAGSGSVGVEKTAAKVRRVISKAKELPLTVELPASISAADGLDFKIAFNESKNVAKAVKDTWQRLNGEDPEREETLISLQRESKALLSLRAEATKLRAGIKLVRRQKELKSAYLVRFGSASDLLGETLRADRSILKLVTELSLKAALLEMERIYITLESELSVTSALVDQLLQAVERYGIMEEKLRTMVSCVQRDEHEKVDNKQLQLLEADIALLLLQLGLATADSKQEAFSWDRSREQLSVNMKKVNEGVSFYSRGTQLFFQDLGLAASMVTRAAVQGYSLKARETKLLRRIGKDTLTVIPFVIILIIPLSPLGHVLVFSFIQRFFPDFFPSQFTESRQVRVSPAAAAPPTHPLHFILTSNHLPPYPPLQNIMSMYSSITTEASDELPPQLATYLVPTLDGVSGDEGSGDGSEAVVEGAAEEVEGRSSSEADDSSGGGGGSPWPPRSPPTFPLKK